MKDTKMIGILGNLVVADFLNTQPITATSDTPMSEIVKIFLDHGFGGIPIVDDGILQGMAMKRDLLEIYFIPHHEVDDTEKLIRLVSLMDPSKTVSEFMEPDPVTVTPACKASRLAQLMIKDDTFVFPVIKEKGLLPFKAKREFLGIVTLTDMLPLLYEAIVRGD